MSEITEATQSLSPEERRKKWELYVRDVLGPKVSELSTNCETLFNKIVNDPDRLKNKSKYEAEYQKLKDVARQIITKTKEDCGSFFENAEVIGHLINMITIAVRRLLDRVEPNDDFSDIVGFTDRNDKQYPSENNLLRFGLKELENE